MYDPMEISAEQNVGREALRCVLIHNIKAKWNQHTIYTRKSKYTFVTILEL